MRPLVLKIQAFGPYCEEVILDFADLKGELLFLIHGATGAGKTMILDAIVYALFGTTSGGLRTGETLRSDFADSTLETVVEFTFALGNKKYRMERRPKQELKKKRGDGVRRVDAQAGLYEEKDGEWVLLTDRKSELAEQIKELFGFEAKQFLQVVLLPQGEFRRFLVASTLEREKILKSLFHTERYAALQEELKKKAQVLLEERKLVVHEKERLLGKAEVANQEEWVGKIKRYEEALSAAKVREEEKTRLQSWLRELVKWLDEKVSSEAGLQEKSLVLKEQEEALKRTQEALQPFLLEKEEIEKGVHAYEQQKEELLRMKDVVMRAEAYEKNGEELSLLRTWFSKNSLEPLEVEKEQIAKEQAEKESLLYEVQEQIVALSGIEEEKKRLEVLKARYILWQQKDAEFIEKREEIHLLEETVQKLREAYVAKELSEKALYEAFCSGQAFALGQDLQEGELCPVCGSTSHPHLADKPEEYVTETEWKKAQSERDEALQKWQALEKTQKAALEMLVRNQEGLKEERNAAELSEVELEKALQLVTKKKEELSRLIAKKASLEKAVADAKVRYSKVEIALIAFREEMVQRKTRAASLKEFIQETEAYFKGNVPAVSLLLEKEQALSLAVGQYEQCRKQNKEQLEKKQTALQMAKEALKSVQGAIEVYARRLKVAEQSVSKILLESKVYESRKDINLEGVKVQLAQADAAYKGAIAATKEWTMQLEREKADYHSYLDILKRERGEATYSAMVFKLSDLANGGKQGFWGLTFERYVLGAFLEEVIEAANFRLTRLTRGRFSLERVEAEESGNRSQGLDLAIFDSETGTSRPAITLSGGESFLASLALSLGLADVVQSYAGGVHLDTIFVDEGFGTLDPEAFDIALDALSSLQESGRLVGLISHVPELKTRIAAHLEVVKLDRGSTAYFARM